MKQNIDKLSEGLADRYKIYIETFLVDLWSDEGLIEFRVEYALRSDHVLRSFTVKVSADSAIDDAERRAVTASVFVEIEDHIDEAIASQLVAAN